MAKIIQLGLLLALLSMASQLQAQSGVLSQDAEACLMAHPDDPVCLQRYAQQNQVDHNRYTLGYQYGYDTNYLRATSAQSLVLTLPTVDLLLPLSSLQQPVSQDYHRLSLGVTHQHLSGSVPWQVQANVQVDQLNTQAQGKQAAQLQFVHPWQGAQLVYTLKHYDMIQLGSYRIANAALFYPIGVASYLGADIETSRTPQQQTDGNYVGLNWLYSLSNTTHLLFKAGQDNAQYERAGDAQYRWQLGLNHQQPIAKGLLNLAIAYQLKQDSKGYSPLLNHNAIREQAYYHCALEYAHPLNDHLQLALALEHWQQDSNLALFNANGQQLSLALRWQKLQL